MRYPNLFSLSTQKPQIKKFDLINSQNCALGFLQRVFFLVRKKTVCHSHRVRFIAQLVTEKLY